MGNSLSREQFFKENDINPYKFLGVSKNTNKKDIKIAYKKKALNLHPDKNNGDDLEFKILIECYQYLIDKFTEIEQVTNKQTSTHEVLKEQSKQTFNYNQEDRNFTQTNFNHQETRKNLFVNNNLDFTTFDDVIYNKSKGPKEYSSVSYKQPTKLFKNDEKFNLKKFNKMFEEIKVDVDDTQVETQAIEAQSSLAPMSISTYGGLIIEKPELQDVSNIINTNTPIKSKKKHIKFKEENVNKLFNQRKNEEVSIDTSRTFAEAEAVMYENQINNMRQEMNANRDNILKHINVFPPDIIDQFNKGLLQDSSTCVDGEKLVIPLGIRKK